MKASKKLHPMNPKNKFRGDLISLVQVMDKLDEFAQFLEVELDFYVKTHNDNIAAVLQHVTDSFRMIQDEIEQERLVPTADA